MKKVTFNSLIVSSIVLLSAPLVLPSSIFADGSSVAIYKDDDKEPSKKPDPEPEPEEPAPDPEPEEPSKKPDPEPEPEEPSSSSKPSSSKPAPSPSKPNVVPPAESGGGSGVGSGSSGSSGDSNSSGAASEEDLSKKDEKKLDDANEKLEDERNKYQANIDAFDQGRSSDTARVLISDIKEISYLIKKTSANYEKAENDVDSQIAKNKLLTYVYLAAQIYYTPDSPNQAVKEARAALQMSFVAASLKPELINEIRSVEDKYDIQADDSILDELGVEEEINNNDALKTVQSSESNLVIFGINIAAASAIALYVAFSNRRKG